MLSGPESYPGLISLSGLDSFGVLVPLSGPEPDVDGFR